MLVLRPCRSFLVTVWPLVKLLSSFLVSALWLCNCIGNLHSYFSISGHVNPGAASNLLFSLSLTFSEMAVTWKTFRKLLFSNQQNETPLCYFWHEVCHPFGSCVSFSLLFPPSLLLSPLLPILFLFFFLQTLLSPYLLSIIVERYFAINMPTWVKRSLDSPTLHICPCG